MIDSNGRIIVSIIHEGVYSFYPDFNWSGRERFHYESVFYVKDGDSLKVAALIDAAGNILIPFHYDYIAIDEEEPVIHLMKGDSSYRAISPACR